MIEVRLADGADWRAFYGASPAEDDCLALVCLRDGRPVAVGGVVWRDGAACGFVDKRGNAPASAIWRGALRLIDALRQAGEPAIYAACDRSDLGRRFLSRLGFEPFREVGGLEVWALLMGAGNERL